jgi:DNA-binding NarL/FixJ family response regulator
MAGHEPDPPVHGHRGPRRAREESRHRLEEFGGDVEVAGDARGAPSRLRRRPEVDLVLLDMALPGMNGVAAFLQRVLHHRPARRVVVHGPYRLRDQEELALRQGAAGVFVSARRDDDLARAVRLALDGRRPRRPDGGPGRG